MYDNQMNTYLYVAELPVLYNYTCNIRIGE